MFHLAFRVWFSFAELGVDAGRPLWRTFVAFAVVIFAGGGFRENVKRLFDTTMLKPF